MKNSLALFLVVCCALACAESQATPIGSNLVINGGFETGDFTGWDGGGARAVDTAAAHSGTFGAFVTNGFARISQPIDVLAGANYDFSFFLRSTGSSNGNQDSFFQVLWNGFVLLNLVNPAPFAFTEFDFHNLQGPQPIGVEPIPFEFQISSSGSEVFSLDDVSFSQAVPESFSTLWAVLPIFGLLGFERLRRKESYIGRCVLARRVLKSTP
jgi:hypothetical protein